MRSRPHEIKIRLNDHELDRLNKMVARTHFDRETFLRLMLEGYTLRESPRDYKEFEWELRRLASDLRLYRWNDSMSEQQRQELDRLMSERGKMLKDMEALHEKLNTVSRELQEAQAMLNQNYAHGDRQPYSGNGVYGMPNSMNGRF